MYKVIKITRKIFNSKVNRLSITGNFTWIFRFLMKDEDE
jgi:hypothetical protein